MASSVKLGETLETYVDGLVAAGRYGSRSEVLREGVRLVQEREGWVRMIGAAVDEGLADEDAGRVHDIDVVRQEMATRFASKT